MVCRAAGFTPLLSRLSRLTRHFPWLSYRDLFARKSQEKVPGRPAGCGTPATFCVSRED